MADDGLTPILRRLEIGHAPDPRFGAELFATLRPLALEAGRHDASFVGRLRSAIVGRLVGLDQHPTSSRVQRLVFVAIVAALVIALVVTVIGRPPTRPFVHNASFGFYQVSQDDGVPSATALGRRVLAASPDGSYLLVNEDWPRPTGMLSIIEAQTDDAQALDSEPGEVSAAWSTDNQLAWDVAPLTVDGAEAPPTLHLIRPDQPAERTWSVPQGSGRFPSGIGSFAWSPDGRRLAVTTLTGDLADHLYVVDAATAIGHELGVGIKPSELAWSQDGGSIAVLLEDTGELVKIDVSNGDVSQLGGWGPGFAWTAGGGLLVSGEGGIWRIHPDRLDRQLVAVAPDLGGPLIQSPDGSMVAFTGVSTGPDAEQQWLTLWAVPTTGGQPRLLADRLWYRWQPSWSPDGQWILFTQGPVGSRSLWVIHPDGTGLQQMVPPGAGAP